MIKKIEKMKLKGLFIVAIVAIVASLSSCRSGYTCPTYSKNNVEKQTILVKEAPSTAEVNS